MSRIVYNPESFISLRNDLKEKVRGKHHEEVLELMQRLKGLYEYSKDSVYMEILEESLEWMCTEGFTDGAKKALEFGIEPDKRDIHGNTALTLAAERGHTDIVKLLLQAGCDVNRTDLETRTALHWSAMNGNTGVVEQLLLYGAVPDEKDGLYGFTPLMLSARQGHAQIVKMLLEKGCDPNKTDIHSETALFDAVRNGQAACVRLLIIGGANLNHTDEHGRTCLLAAALWNQVAVAAILVKHNSCLSTPGRIQYVTSQCNSINSSSPVFTPIAAAVMEGKQDIADILYIGGVDISELHKYSHDHLCREYIKRVTRNDGIELVLDWLIDKCSTPRSLKDSCRVVIRRCLHERWTEQFSQLPMPRILLDFLDLPELEPYLSVPKRNFSATRNT